jgi:hypothetical protein
VHHGSRYYLALISLVGFAYAAGKMGHTKAAARPKRYPKKQHWILDPRALPRKTRKSKIIYRKTASGDSEGICCIDYDVPYYNQCKINVC